MSGYGGGRALVHLDIDKTLTPLSQEQRDHLIGTLQKRGVRVEVNTARTNVWGSYYGCYWKPLESHGLTHHCRRPFNFKKARQKVEHLRRASREHNVAPQCAVLVDDNSHNRRAASQAGFGTVVVNPETGASASAILDVLRRNECL